MNIDKQYNNYIPLGTRCHLALDLIFYGQRVKSYPFDWLVCNYQLIRDTLFNNSFPFKVFDDLYQSANKPSCYYNYEYDLWFAHDFNEYEPFCNQIKKVIRKYKKRSHRFFKDIKKPTLFLRYVESQQEIDFIENYYDLILEKIKEYNPNNDICFITTNALVLHSSLFYITQYDEVVASGGYQYIITKKPLRDNDRLNYYFGKLHRKENLIIFRIIYFLKKIRKLFVKILNSYKNKNITYIHNKRVNFG